MFKVNELASVAQGKIIGGSRSLEVKGISIDTRTIKKTDAFIAIKGKDLDGHDFIDQAIKKGSRCIIAERINPKSLNKKTVFIRVKDTIKALGNIARFHRERFDIPVIAVTGSNGKTTTKDMIAWTLSKKFKVLKNEGTKNNHIGLPMTLLGLDNSHCCVVIEAGTNHPGEIEYLARIARPTIAVITNIGHSHLEHLKTVDGVFKEKITLLKHLVKPSIAILNADDEHLKKLAASGSKRPFVIAAGVTSQADFTARNIIRDNDTLEFLVNGKYLFALKVLGLYNVYNALMAVAVGRIFGMKYEEISSRLASFSLPQNRLTFFERKKIKFINDTYNSNPLSLRQALDTLEHYSARGKKIFIMGDMMELGSRKEALHFQAGCDAAGVCDIFVAVGDLSKFAAEGARKSGLEDKNIFTCKNSKAAKELLLRKIAPCSRDIILVKGSRSMTMEEVFNF
jgi:UDP-N-acetylmuramoyl-tripeptide--D-alanyl-D-alanine ligase